MVLNRVLLEKELKNILYFYKNLGTLKVQNILIAHIFNPTLSLDQKELSLEDQIKGSFQIHVKKTLSLGLASDWSHSNPFYMRILKQKLTSSNDKCP